MPLSDRSHKHFEIQQAFGDPLHWWRAGGTIKDTDTIEAWQAICAQTYGASVSGLVHGITLNDANKAGIVWSQADGWIGDGVGYLVSAIPPVFPYENGSVFVRFSGAVSTSSYLFGASDGVNMSQWALSSLLPPAIIGTWWNGDSNHVALQIGSGSFVSQHVVGFAGKSCYLDGALIGTLPTGGAANVQHYYIMARNLSGAADGPTLASVQAIAFYSIALSPTQAAILSALMLNLCQRRPFILDQSALDGRAELQ